MVMHERARFRPGEPLAATQGGAPEYLRFGDIWRFLKGNTAIIGVGALLGIGVGGLYLANTPPTYSAYARIVIDPEPARLVSQEATSGALIVEAGEVASKVEIVKSEAIALAVIRQLDLTKDPELMEGRSWRGRIKHFLSMILGKTQTSQQGSLEDELLRRAMAGYLSRVEVRRVGQSYVLEIGYTSTDPKKAAITANAIAMAYIRTGIDAKSETARSGANWLEGRLLEVGRRAREAALAVQEFRAQHQMPQVGSDVSLDERQISEINAQLLSAQAQTSEEDAKLATLDRVLTGKDADGYVDEALRSAQIQRLREAIIAATAKLNEIESRFGKNSPSALAIQSELTELNGSIRAELLRIRAVYSANLETARTREALLEADFQKRLESASKRNDARADLAELDSRASTYRRMYESVLQQLMSTSQRESFPVGEARIVTPAATPFVQSWPKSSVILPFAMMCGAFAGIGGAAARMLLDRRLSRPGLLRGLGLGEYGRITRLTENGRASMAHSLSVLRDTARSPFGRALTSAKNLIDAPLRGRSKHIVGVCPTSPGVGATTIAVNLARLYQAEGAETAVVVANEGAGLLETVQKFGFETGLRLSSRPIEADSQEALPVFSLAKAAGPEQGFTLPQLKALLDAATQAYPVVVVDLPPLENLVELQDALAKLDSIVLVDDMGSPADADEVEAQLASLGQYRSKVTGLIFNRVDTASLPLWKRLLTPITPYLGLASRKLGAIARRPGKRLPIPQANPQAVRLRQPSLSEMRVAMQSISQRETT